MKKEGWAVTIIFAIILAVILIFFIINGSLEKSGEYRERANQKIKNETGIGNETIPTETAKLEISSEIEKNCIGFLVGSAEEIATVKKINAGWTRPHPGPFAWGFIEKSRGNFNFEQTDSYVKQAQENNIAILATTWPFADWDQQCKSNCDVSTQDIFYPREKLGISEGIPAKRCKPCNMQDYKNFLKKLVERYDGDGIEDMPGLKIPIKYYEILNEPEMKGNDMTFFKGNEQDYVEILKASYEAVKETCPDCKVVQAGAAGTEQMMLDFWGKIFSLNAGNYFDIANIHYINNGDKSTLNVKDFKNLMQKYSINKPTWVTEAEYGSPAEEIKSSVEGALKAGAEKIFFTRFEIGNKSPPSGSYSQQYEGITSLCKPS